MGTPAPGCNGTVYNILKEGSGAEVAKGATVTVHATGTWSHVENKAALRPASAAQAADSPMLAAPSCRPGYPVALVKPALRRHSAPFWPDLGGLAF